jgi:hypothetical protein
MVRPRPSTLYPDRFGCCQNGFVNL